LTGKEFFRIIHRFYAKQTLIVYNLYFRAGEGPVKIRIEITRDGADSTPTNRVTLRKKDNKRVTPRDEKTASIRSYPKRLSPTILSDEFYSSFAGCIHSILYKSQLILAYSIVYSENCKHSENVYNDLSIPLT